MSEPRAGAPADVLVALLDPAGRVISCRVAGGEGRPPGPWSGTAAVGARDFVELAAAAGLRISEATQRLVRDACHGGVLVPVRFTLEWTAQAGAPPRMVSVASRLSDDGACVGATVTVQVLDDLVPWVDENWTQMRDGSRPISQALDTIDDLVLILKVPSLWPVYANQAAMQWLGRTDTGGLTYPRWAVLSPAASAELRDAMHDVAGGHRAHVQMLVQATGETGEDVWLDVRLRPLATWSSGVSPPEYVLVVGHYVTERVRVEERLRISEQSFRAAFEHSSIPTIVATIHPDGRRRIVMANQALSDATGHPLEALIGSDASPFHQKVGTEQSRRFNAAFIAGTLPEPVLVRQDVRADGTPVWFDVFLSRIDVAGEDAPAALVHLVDVTDRTLAEQRKERQSRVIAAHAELVTRILQGDDQTAVEQTMLDELRAVLDADDVVLVVEDPSTHERSVRRGAGDIASDLARRGRVLDPATSRHLGAERQSLVDAEARSDDGLPMGAVARFDVDEARGWVCVARRQPPLTRADLDVVGGFVRQTAMALELGRARADQERLRRLQERHRLARDLHDTVLQDIIAMGVQLGLVRKQLDGDAERRVVGVMQELVATTRTLRAAVFELQRPLDDESFHEAIQAVVAAAARALGHHPTVAVAGELDAVPAALRSDVVAALQEALSNVIRHARAREVAVSLEVTSGNLVLRVSDDGVGATHPNRRHPGQGLLNLAARAETAGGTSRLEARAAGGTVLTWSVPLPGAARRVPAPVATRSGDPT